MAVFHHFEKKIQENINMKIISIYIYTFTFRKYIYLYVYIFRTIDHNFLTNYRTKRSS